MHGENVLGKSKITSTEHVSTNNVERDDSSVSIDVSIDVSNHCLQIFVWEARRSSCILD